jgi:DNA polymerase III epsilon subunit-like protein
MNNLHLIVFDFETGGLKPGYHEPIQVAGKAFKPNMKPVPLAEGGEFCSYMKPLYFDRLDPQALAVNKIKVETLQDAPEQAVVWRQFIAWVNGFNPRKNRFAAPIAGGKNIRNFDLKFVAELNKLHGPKGENTLLFSDRLTCDLEDLLFAATWNDAANPNNKMSLDWCRQFFRLSTAGAHDALVDVRQTADLMVGFLHSYDAIRQHVKANGKKLWPLEGSRANHVLNDEGVYVEAHRAIARPN